jgi:hypothetical protein
LHESAGRQFHWTRRRNAFFRLFDTGHRHGRGARGVWLRAVSPFAAGLIANEQAIAISKCEGEELTLAKKEAVSQL